LEIYKKGELLNQRNSTFALGENSSKRHLYRLGVANFGFCLGVGFSEFRMKLPVVERDGFILEAHSPHGCGIVRASEPSVRHGGRPLK